MTGLALPPGYTLDAPPTAAGLALPEGYTLDAPPDPAVAARAAAVAAAPDHGALTASTNAIGNALSFNLMDEAFARADAGVVDPILNWITGNNSNETYDQRLNRHLESLRVRSAAAEAQHPIASTVGRVGAIAAMAPKAIGETIVAPVLRAATTGERVVNAAVGAGKGAVGGAGYGFASGYGAGEGGIEPRLQSGLEAVPSGAVTGAALGGVIGGVSRVPVGPAPPPARDVAAAGQRQGVSVPRFLGSDNPIVQQAGGLAKSLPFVGTRIVNAAKKTIADFAAAKTKVAEGYSGGAAETPASAGLGVRTALEDWIGPKTEGVITNEYNKVDALINPAIQTPLSETARTAAQITSRNKAIFQPPGNAVDFVRQAASSPNGLAYHDIKYLRTRVREMLDNPSLLPAGSAPAEWKQVYAALTKDLRASTTNAGGAPARQALDRANLLNARVAARREELTRFLGPRTPVTAENLFDAIHQKATSGKGADIIMLHKLRSTMPADAWDNVASGVVERMGRSAAKGEVSLDTFFTEYNKLSDAGKRALFGNKPDLAAALNDLATIAGRHKEIQTYANPSGSGQAVAGFGTLLAATNPGAWLHLAGAGIGGHFLTRALTRPATVRAMTGWARVWDQVNRGTRAGVQPGSLEHSLSFVSRRFATEIGRQFGFGADRVNALASALAGSSDVPAANPTEANNKQ